MRQLSVAVMRGRYKASSRRTPKAGTKLRTTYDYFLAHKGIPIEYDVSGANNVQLRQLRDSYGMDIRRISKRKYCLCGEWLSNGVYIDYIAEHLEQT